MKPLSTIHECKFRLGDYTHRPARTMPNTMVILTWGWTHD